MWAVIISAWLLQPSMVLPHLGLAQDSRSRLEFWENNYSELLPTDDPRVAKAHGIFTRLLNVAGRRAGVIPRLLIVKNAGPYVPLAIALPDGGIVISRQVLDVCYGEPALGDDRLAFVLAHEIAHQLKDDFWHMRFFHAVELSREENPSDTSLLDEVKKIAALSNQALAKELQCDEYAIVYASMAGFETSAIVTGEDRANFFRYVAASLDPGNVRNATKDPNHPSSEARAAAVKARLKQVIDFVDLFELGLLFFQTGDYERAAQMFAEFLRFYPAREVYHDLAA